MGWRGILSRFGYRDTSRGVSGRLLSSRNPVTVAVASPQAARAGGGCCPVLPAVTDATAYEGVCGRVTPGGIVIGGWGVLGGSQASAYSPSCCPPTVVSQLCPPEIDPAIMCMDVNSPGGLGGLYPDPSGHFCLTCQEPNPSIPFPSCDYKCFGPLIPYQGAVWQFVYWVIHVYGASTPYWYIAAIRNGFVQGYIASGNGPATCSPWDLMDGSGGITIHAYYVGCICSASGGSGGGPITKPCCPTISLPFTLTAVIFGSAGCDQTFPISYNPVTGEWGGPGLVGPCCEHAIAFVLACDGTGPAFWRLQVGSLLLFPTAATCSPVFSLTYAGADYLDVCPKLGGGTIVITES